MRVLTLAALLAMASMAAGKNLPEKFFGSFTLDRQINMDPYLEYIGIDYFNRKRIIHNRLSIIYTKKSLESFNLEIYTNGKYLTYNDIVLNQAFVGEGFTLKENISFSVPNDDVVWEWHFPIDPHIKDDMYTLNFEGGELVQTFSFPHGTAKRYFKRD